jgi:hypothetical protein
VNSLDKIGFYSVPEHHGVILIRGRQLDGVNQVLFHDPAGSTALVVMTVPGPQGMVALTAELSVVVPTYVYVPASGCYAWQVDGAEFSEVIVFKAGSKS